MTDKELRKLSRRALLELLIAQSEELDRVKMMLEKANRELNDKILLVDNAGSIAEASMEMNNVFLAAQQAADQYLENIVALQKRTQADRIKAEEDARGILEQARREREDLLEQTRQECRQMLLCAKENACTMQEGK